MFLLFAVFVLTQIHYLEAVCAFTYFSCSLFLNIYLILLSSSRSQIHMRMMIPSTVCNNGMQSSLEVECDPVHVTVACLTWRF